MVLSVLSKADSPSMRSLRSLQVVPPPTSKQTAGTSVSDWNPFPAPCAPHASPEQSPSEARDGQECPSSASDDRCARDGAQESPTGDENNMQTANVFPTTPRTPKTRQAEIAAAYSRERRNNYFRSRSKPRGSSASTPPSKHKGGGEGLVKVAANGNVTRSRKSDLSSTDVPILTRGRIDLHHKNQSQIDVSNNHAPAIATSTKHAGTKTSDAASPLMKAKRDINKKDSTSKNVSTLPNLVPYDLDKKTYVFGTTEVYSRTLIPPTVFHSGATDLWIVTINNKSKLANSIDSSSSSRSSSNHNSSLKAFSFRTEKEARASAYANAPPVMLPFDQHPQCMLCSTKFTLFKRPRHCRNCGACICSNYACSTTWSKKMCPETYNVKKESSLKVCTSCDNLAKRFQHALLHGQYGTAVELYQTGNINLRVPFKFKGKNQEAMFPIHCAIEGKSEKLVRWLVDAQHCPIHVMSTSNTRGGGVVGAGVDMIKSLGSSNEKSKHKFLPTLKTSKGRSVMDIAMKAQHVGILRFLINEKDASVYEVEDLELALGAMEALAKEFPVVDGSYDPEMFADTNGTENKTSKARKENDHTRGNRRKSATPERASRKTKNATETSPKKENMYSVSATPPIKKLLIPRDIHGVREGAGLYGVIGGYGGNNDSSDENIDDEENAVLDDDDDEKSVSTTVPDTCILCRKEDVNCVATPCGHQMCCLTCSTQRRRCPVCNLECQFIEIYQP